MSQSPKTQDLLTVRAANVLRMWLPLAAICAVVGLLAVGARDRGVDGAGLPSRGADARAAQIRVAALPAAQMPPGDSGVHDAREALAGGDEPTEEPAPTF
ncbi:MAG: hypothetical protein ABIN96_12440 [Rubrivivax sp.]